MKKSKEIKCEYCLAHYPKDYRHICPPWLKALKANHDEELIRQMTGKNIEFIDVTPPLQDACSAHATDIHCSKCEPHPYDK